MIHCRRMRSRSAWARTAVELAQPITARAEVAMLAASGRIRYGMCASVGSIPLADMRGISSLLRQRSANKLRLHRVEYGMMRPLTLLALYLLSTALLAQRL